MGAMEKVKRTLRPYGSGVQAAATLAGVVVASALVLYTSYRLATITFQEYSADTPPFNQLPGAPVAPLPYLGPQSLAGLAVLGVKALAVILGFLATYYSLRGGGVGRSIMYLYVLLVIATGTGNVGLSDIAVLVTATMLLLYTYPFRRGVELALYGKGRPEFRSSGSRAASLAFTLASYFIPLSLSIGIASIIAGMTAVATRIRLDVPPPLPNIWDLFLETRIAVIVLGLTVILVVLWLIGDLIEGILLVAILTPEEALDLAYREAMRDFEDLESWKTWHQAIPLRLQTFLASIIIYIVVLEVIGSLETLLDPYLATAGLPWYFRSLLSLAVVIALWRSVADKLRKLITMQGDLELNRTALALTVMMIGFLVALWQQGAGTLDPIYYALGLKAPTSSGDVISKLNLWPQDIGARIEGMFKSFEKIARLVIRFLWG